MQRSPKIKSAAGINWLYIGGIWKSRVGTIVRQSDGFHLYGLGNSDAAWSSLADLIFHADSLAAA